MIWRISQGAEHRRLKRLQPAQRECMRRKKYKTRKEAWQDLFAAGRLKTNAYRPADYIAFFNSPLRKHSGDGMMAQIALEKRPKHKLNGVQQTRGGIHR